MSGTTAPVKCEAGGIRTTEGAASPTDCAVCSEGFYCIDNAEEPCLAGHYCPERSTLPTPCDVGKYVDYQEAKLETECIDCPAGYLCNVEGVSDKEMFQCPVGHYCEVQALEAIICPEGTYRNERGAASVDDCLDCRGLSVHQYFP